MHKKTYTVFLFGCWLLALAVSPCASADEIKIYWTQPLAFNLPQPTTGLYIGLNLCNTNSCRSNPNAAVSAFGPFGVSVPGTDTTFRVDKSAPGFAALAGYMLNPNPDPFTFVFPYAGYYINGSFMTFGNSYFGHFSDYPRPFATIAELIIQVPAIDHFDVLNGIWVARGSDGREVLASYGLEGTNLVPEGGSTFAFLIIGLLVLAVSNRRLRGRR